MSDQIIHNLIRYNWIKPGTWLGVTTLNKITHMVVQRANTTTHAFTCVNPSDDCIYQVPFHAVTEVDGMLLHRFLTQADLTSEGTPIQNLVRRGRKRKITS